LANLKVFKLWTPDSSKGAKFLVNNIRQWVTFQQRLEFNKITIQDQWKVFSGSNPETRGHQRQNIVHIHEWRDLYIPAVVSWSY